MKNHSVSVDDSVWVVYLTHDLLIPLVDMFSNYVIFVTDGRSSGAPRNHDHHLSPPDLEDSSEGSGDPQRGRGHFEQGSQLQAPDRTQVRLCAYQFGKCLMSH